MRLGGGVPFEDYNHDLVCGLEKLNGPSFRTLLTRKWLPSIPGMVEKLQAGIRVADLGCGTGLASISMAKGFPFLHHFPVSFELLMRPTFRLLPLFFIFLSTAFPKSQFYGFDISGPSIERAQAHAKAENLTNVTFQCKNAAEFETSPGYDFIVTFDVIHDLTRPLEVLTVIYQALRPGGLYLMVEPRAGNTLAENLQNPTAGLMYSISTMSCMTTSLSGGGPGYGTMMGPAKAEELCRQVGFRSFKKAAVQNLTNSFFEVRKELPSKL